MITIVNYGMGNIQSVLNAFEHLDHAVKVIDEPSALAHAEKLVLPGVGSFKQAAERLDAGFRDALDEAVKGRGCPILGICLGMQLLAARGTEHGESRGLGWIDGIVEKIPTGGNRLRLPHVGWNGLGQIDRDCPLFASVDDGADCYFVHSYQLNATDPDDITAITEYGGTLTAAVARGNVFGTQFHPEKSQPVGLIMLDAFARL